MSKTRLHDSQELESVAEFLTGNRLAGLSLPWQALRNEDLRVLRDWASDTLPFLAQRRLMRDLRQALRRPPDGDSQHKAEPAPTDGFAAPGLLRAARRSAAVCRIAGRQAKLLLDACDAEDTPLARRDAAVLALMLGAGLRRKEAVDLRRGDYDDEDGRVRVSSRNGHARSIVLESRARQAVEAWLRLRGSWTGPLIAALSPNGSVQLRGLTGPAVNRLLARRLRQAGSSGITPRDLRASFLWQLRTASRERPRCRYYQDEDGQPAWVLTSA